LDVDVERSAAANLDDLGHFRKDKLASSGTGATTPATNEEQTPVLKLIGGISMRS
jgi:hypothetical protein